MSCLRRPGVFRDVPARFLAAGMPRLYPLARGYGITWFQAGHCAPCLALGGGDAS
jgi:hypothetical protein